MAKHFVCIVFFLVSTQDIVAQQVQASFMGGPNKFDFQTLVVQPLDGEGNFSFTNLAFFQRYTDEADQPFDELGVQGAVFWNMTKGLGIGPGLYYNNPKGLMPKVLLQSFHRIGSFTLVANPAVYYHEDGFWGGELYAQASFIKSLSQKWSLFGQINTLTTWDQFNSHGRSFIQLRAGPRMLSGIQFGLALDKDWYTPQKFSQSSIGLFVEQWF